MNKADFLAKVREAARQGGAHEVQVPPIGPEVGYVGGGPDLVARLAAEVEAVGGKPRVVDDWQEAAAAIAELLDSHRPGSVLCWDHETLEAAGVGALLAERGIRCIRLGQASRGDATNAALSQLAPEDQRRELLAAEMGITSVAYAVAETGTMALDAKPGRERSASLLPPVYLTIVHAGQIVPDLFDLFAKLQYELADLTSCYSLITGPSKTGDIELRLTTGVHGPGVWHVVVVRAQPSP
jgi:L-lactate dehydrogenase complex protein LldG